MTRQKAGWDEAELVAASASEAKALGTIVAQRVLVEMSCAGTVGTSGVLLLEGGSLTSSSDPGSGIVYPAGQQAKARNGSPPA